MQKKQILTTTGIVLVVAAAAFASFKVYADKANADKNIGVAARINGEVVTVDEIKKGYDDNPQIAEQVAFDQFYPKAVDIFVNGKLLYQAATKAGTQETPEYKAQLKVAEEDLARKVYLENAVAQKVTETAVKDFYDNEYVKNYQSKKEAKAKHILVENEVTAKEVIKKLNSGEKFDDIAKQYTKDSTVELGYFSEDIMVPEFSKAAFALKKGEYSKAPVKSPFGYHVILVEDFRDSAPLPLKDIEPQIKNMLSQKAIAEIFDSLYKNSIIQKFDLQGKEIVVAPENPAK